MISLYTGEISEEKLLDISYVFYSDLIKELGLMLNYQATSTLMANPYAGEEGSEIIFNTNPLNYKDNEKPKRLTMGAIKAAGLIE